MTDRRRAQILCWSSLVAVVILWEVASRGAWINPRYLPAFLKVVATAGHLFAEQEFVQALRVTGLELGLAYGLAAVLGVSLGLVAGANSLVNRVLSPIITGIFATPKIVLLPFFLLAFGIDIPQKVYFGAFHGMWIIAINVMAGTQEVDHTLVRASRAMGATAWQVWTKISLPSMVPLLFVGLRSGIIFTFLGVILAEMSVSKRGLGRLIIQAGDTGNMPRMLAVVLLITMASILFNSTLAAYEQRLFRWKRPAL